MGKIVKMKIVGATAILTILLMGGGVAVADAPMLSGDVNGDGMVDALDITTVERIIAGLDAPIAGADVNQDGTINVLDITKIERIIAGLD